MYHILYHELAHVYCVHKELDGKNFYDEYCENYAKDRVTDGQINVGYAVWRELISETIAIDCDEEYRRNFLIEKEKIISYYRSELGNKYGTLALSKLITEVLTSIDVVGAEEWEQAERVIMNSEFFDNPLLVEVFRVIFIQLRTKCLKIDIEFISELGLLCLEVIAYEGHSLKSRLEI